MTMSWMLYCLAVSALLTVAAEAIERLVRSRGLPRRWCWVCALTISLGLPAWALLTNRPPGDGSATTRHVAITPIPAFETLSPRPIPTKSSGNPRSPEYVAGGAPVFSPPFLRAASQSAWVVWLSASGVLIVLLATGWLRIHRERSRWRRTTLNGCEVMVSQAIGPAIVGFFRPRIVLPEWVLALDEARRTLVLVHEEEHLRARDGQVLLLASIAFVLMPWNVALWYQVRRLRLAVEIDCDARVLLRHPYPRQYGDLLLDVGHRAPSGLVQMAALSEPVSFLGRRVDAMMSVRRQSRVAALRSLGIALAMVTMACMAPRPPSPRPAPSPAANKAIVEVRPNVSGSSASVGVLGTERSPSALRTAKRTDAIDIDGPPATDSLPRMVTWGPERMTTDSLIRRIFGRTLSAIVPVTLEFLVDADDRVISAGMRTDSVGESSDIRRFLARSTGHRSVAAADIRSIDIDRSAWPIPGITSVVWLRLKPGATVNPVRLSSGAIVGEDGIVRDEPSRPGITVGHDGIVRSSSSSTRAPRPRGSASYPARQSVLVFPEVVLAAAKRIYPDFFNNEQRTPGALWFLADSSNRILASRIDRSTLGSIGIAEVLAAFPGVARNRVESWTVTSNAPFPIVWVSVKPES